MTMMWCQAGACRTCPQGPAAAAVLVCPPTAPVAASTNPTRPTRASNIRVRRIPSPRIECCPRTDGRRGRVRTPDAARHAYRRLTGASQTPAGSTSSDGASASALAVDRSQDRRGKHERHEQRQDPPGGDVGVGDERGSAESDGDPGVHPPVVPDDEVPPEEAERRQAVHVAAPDCAGLAWPRIHLVRAAATTPRKTRITGRARSEPGQLTPRPSPAQNTPNVVRRSPTTNLIVFSGTRASGARMTRPAARTTTRASAAATTATSIRRCVPPKVTTMNAT